MISINRAILVDQLNQLHEINVNLMAIMHTTLCMIGELDDNEEREICIKEEEEALAKSSEPVCGDYDGLVGEQEPNDDVFIFNTGPGYDC